MKTFLHVFFFSIVQYRFCSLIGTCVLHTKCVCQTLFFQTVIDTCTQTLSHTYKPHSRMHAQTAQNKHTRLCLKVATA